MNKWQQQPDGSWKIETRFGYKKASVIPKGVNFFEDDDMRPHSVTVPVEVVVELLQAQGFKVEKT